jgi:hypothetical protein
MKGLNGLSVIFLVLSIVIWIQVTATANEIPQNMRFDPLPQPGDTSVSGTCGQTGNCNGTVAVGLAIEGVPQQEWPIIGQGSCVDGRFTINPDYAAA